MTVEQMYAASAILVIVLMILCGTRWSMQALDKDKMRAPKKTGLP